LRIFFYFRIRKEGNTVASYTYDENGLRLTKTVGDTIHEYFYNNEVLDMEVVKKNGEVTQYRSYEWDGYTPLGLIVKEKEASGNYQTKTYQYITNQRGDVLSIRDQKDQEVGSYRYDAYGNVLSVEGDVAKDNPIRYAGYYYDEETKNYYLQARYYNPENGAFLALDPHPGDDDEPLSQNGYTYGNNNSVMNVDPNGKLSRKLKYSIAAGVAFLISELLGGISFNTISGAVATAYATYQLHLKYNGLHSYTSIMKDFKHNKGKIMKGIKKQARRVALRVGLRSLVPISGLSVIYCFSEGMYEGYKHYKKYSIKNFSKIIEKKYH